jgi:GNAT superfamily N-acetyltransferase
MDFLLSQKEDLHSIMNIVGDAQSFLASLEIDQWQDGYPDEDIILNDISNKESYIVKNREGDTMGIAMFSTRSEPTYNFIKGNWLTGENVEYAEYGVIHRMAVSSSHRGKGVAKFIFDSCEQLLKESDVASMRIDTHEGNKIMQGLLKKLGYIYCGVIYLDNGDKRLAFEKLFV